MQIREMFFNTPRTLGFCQELGIRSVLTTQVINWARTSVRECDLARRLVYYAARRRTPPKHQEPRLVTLRDPKVHEFGQENLEQLAEVGMESWRKRAWVEVPELQPID